MGCGTRKRGHNPSAPWAPPLPEQGSRFRFSEEPFACGVHSALMDDFNLVRLVVRGVNPRRAPSGSADRRYCTVAASPEDPGGAGEGALLGSAGWRPRTLLNTVQCRGWPIAGTYSVQDVGHVETEETQSRVI